jgi:hypothetical protein
MQVGLSDTEIEPTEMLAPYDAGGSRDDDEPPSRWAALLAWTAIVIGLAGLAWAGYQLLVETDSGSNDEPTTIAIVLPTATQTQDDVDTAPPTAVSLLGSTLDQAEAMTDARIRANGSEPSESVPEGQILRQSPDPGQQLTSNEIVVVLSSGPQPIALADLDVSGLAFDVAAQDLTQAGLNVLRVDEGSPTVPEGRVIRVDEVTARPGDTVHLVVSMGDRVQIPQDLLSMPIDEAVDALEELGFEFAEPVAVSEARIDSAGLDMDQFDIEHGDVVGIQEEEAGFGLWVSSGLTVTLVYFDSSL